jgi:membrane protein DedA with SNARE-associated domain
LKEHFLAWINEYGAIAVYITFSFGLIGLPIPDETILTYVGFLVYGGHMGYIQAVAAGFLGSLTGMSISYVIGRRVGKPFFHRYGKWLYLPPERLELTERWFRRFGPWTILFGYYVPGVRHVTSYMAGISRIPFPTYVIFAGFGALVWALLFITLGYWIGAQWVRVLHEMEGVFRWLIIAAVVCAAAAWLVWTWKRKRKNL